MDKWDKLGRIQAAHALFNMRNALLKIKKANEKLKADPQLNHDERLNDFINRFDEGYKRFEKLAAEALTEYGVSPEKVVRS